MRPDALTPRRWWDGPWPWLAYLASYAIPWLWVPPGPVPLLLSAAALAIFVALYIHAARLRGARLRMAISGLVAIGVAMVPLGGGWSVLALFPVVQAARIRPVPSAIRMIAGCIVIFLIAGFASRTPPIWWLPSLLMPALVGGALLSREAFYDRARALLVTQEEVRRLAGLAERERMTRDIHDVIGRTLTLVALQADLVARQAVPDGEAAAAGARLIGAQARAGLADIRTALDGGAGGGLAREVAASLDALHATGIDAVASGDAMAISADAGAVLAMTLREAVTNVIRHAGAASCRIDLSMEGPVATLTVHDDGIGGPIVEGAGLSGMRQRLIAAGGGLVVAADRAGSRLRASVPA